MIFKNLWLLALVFFSACSYDSSPMPWDDILQEHQHKLDSSGYFVGSDDRFYYFGLVSVQQDTLDAEFEFLLVFHDRVSELLANVCKERGSTLRDSYQFNFPVNKNVVEQAQRNVFVTSVSKQVLKQEAKYACAK